MRAGSVALLALSACTSLPGYSYDAGPDLGRLCSEPCGADASDGGAGPEDAQDEQPEAVDDGPRFDGNPSAFFSDAGCCADCLQSWRDCCSSCVGTCTETNAPDCGSYCAYTGAGSGCSEGLAVCSVGACGPDACAPPPPSCP